VIYRVRIELCESGEYIVTEDEYDTRDFPEIYSTEDAIRIVSEDYSGATITVVEVTNGAQ
jgi:hypothetical protein